MGGFLEEAGLRGHPSGCSGYKASNCKGREPPFQRNKCKAAKPWKGKSPKNESDDAKPWKEEPTWRNVK